MKLSILHFLDVLWFNVFNKLKDYGKTVYSGVASLLSSIFNGIPVIDQNGERYVSFIDSKKI